MTAVGSAALRKSGSDGIFGGTLAWYRSAFVKTPVAVGRRPVIAEVRLGLQMGAWQYARRKRTPRSAKRAMFGVAGVAKPLLLPLASGVEKAGEASVEKSSSDMCRMLIGDGEVPTMEQLVRSARKASPTKAASFEYSKGQLNESPHKVPTSHYRTKHCHAAVAPSFEKGSVESTHRPATTGTRYHTKHCHAAVVSSFEKGSVESTHKVPTSQVLRKGQLTIWLFSTSHWLELKLRLIIFTHDQHETRRHVAPQPFLTSSRLTCSRIQLQTDQIMLSEPGAPVAFCNSKQITRVQCRAALALVCPRRV